MASNYMPKKKSCTSDSSTAPSSPSSIAALSYVNNVHVTGPVVPGTQNGVVLNNGNANAVTQGVANGQAASESPSPGLNNNNAPKYGTPVPNRIFVGGISAQTTESELAQLFSAYGNVKGTKIIVDRAGVSKGYGFVTFETELEARRIMRDAQCVIFKQRKLNIAPAIKKQPFSRSLEVQSPPIGIPSTVMYANGSPYMFHNGMAFFSPPEPTPNFPAAAPASQMPAVPGAAAVCPTMMYPCPPGQPLYQYPYQPVPGHVYRGGQGVQYYTVSAPVVSAESSMQTGSVYCSVDPQVVHYCEPPVQDMVAVPQVLPQPSYAPLNPVMYATAQKPSVKPEEAKPHKKRTRRGGSDSPGGLDPYYVDEGGSGDAPDPALYPRNTYPEPEDQYNPVYYLPNEATPLTDSNYVIEPTTAHYFGSHQNVGLKMPAKQAIVYQMTPAPQGYAPYLPTPNNAPLLLNNQSVYYLPMECGYQEPKEPGKQTTDDRRGTKTVKNGKVRSVTHQKPKSSTKDIGKDLKALKL